MMPTMPELVPLVYASLENKNYDTAKNVVKTLKNHWIAGNTGILYVSEGIFVQDNPELEDGIISMNQKTLQSKLGSHEERGVVFNDDKSIRFTPYNFKIKSQTPLDLSRNTGIIALVGGEENTEKLAKASEHYRAKPYFQIDLTRVTGLGMGSFPASLVVDNIDGFNRRCSFGMQKIKQKVIKKPEIIVNQPIL